MPNSFIISSLNVLYWIFIKSALFIVENKWFERPSNSSVKTTFFKNQWVVSLSNCYDGTGSIICEQQVNSYNHSRISWPINSFSLQCSIYIHTSWKTLKNHRFSNVFRRYIHGTLARNGLNSNWSISRLLFKACLHIMAWLLCSPQKPLHGYRKTFLKVHFINTKFVFS